MIGGKKILAVITARGSSKGLPRKNLLPIGGRPMIAWSIAAGQASRYIDRLVLSSEDEEIVRVAMDLGCEVPFRRPVELATDTALVEDALIHALDALTEAYDHLVLLQPTSPLRRAEDIDGAIEICHRAGAPVCISVCEPEKSPYWMFRKDDAGRLHPLLAVEEPVSRRQDLPLVFASNGAVYVAEVPWFRRHRTFVGPETIAYVMPRERSLDVDTETDLLMVNAVMASASDK